MRLCIFVCVVFIREYICIFIIRVYMRVSVRICFRFRCGLVRFGRSFSFFLFRVRVFLGRCFRDVCWGLLLGTVF